MKVVFHDDVYIDCTHDWFYDEQKVSSISFEHSTDTAIIAFTDDYEQVRYPEEIANKLVSLCLNGGKIVDTEGVEAVELNVTAMGDKPYITIDFTK